jgi:hypothetical protein
MAKNSTKQRQPVTPFNPEPAGIPDPHRGLRGQPSSAFGGAPTSGKLPNQEADGALQGRDANDYGQYGNDDWG